MNKVILSLLLLLLILVLFPKLNRNYENFDDKTNNDSSKKESDENSEKTSDENSEKTSDEEESQKEGQKEGQKEKYYDYHINYNTKSMDRIPGVNDKAININIGYPTQQPIIQQQDPQLVNNTLLSNLAGNPVDQVETDYTVTDSSDMYKSWDKYYLPGYSYFPPSKWQLPKDNAILIPKELRDEKCNVCPLIANNGSDNYLSGDILQGPNNSYKITPQILNSTNNPLYDPVESSLNLNNVENPYVADFVKTNRRNRRQQRREDRRENRQQRREDRREENQE